MCFCTFHPSCTYHQSDGVNLLDQNCPNITSHACWLVISQNRVVHHPITFCVTVDKMLLSYDLVLVLSGWHDGCGLIEQWEKMMDRLKCRRGFIAGFSRSFCLGSGLVALVSKCGSLVTFVRLLWFYQNNWIVKDSNKRIGLLKFQQNDTVFCTINIVIK